MDTPERNQINPPVSQFEDSPVFNYINNLSPIKPVKSVHITQTFNSLSYSSPPSVFTSPHVSCLKESRFQRRHNPLGTSKPKVSSEDVNKVYSSDQALADSTHAHHYSSELQENTDQGISVGDTSIELSSEHTKFSVELPQALKYNCGNPGYDPPLCADEVNSLLELPAEAASDVAHVQEGCKTDSVEDGVHVRGICQAEPKSEGPDCDWDSLIPDATDLLIFNSPNEAEALKGLLQKPRSDFMFLLPQSTINNGQKMQVVDAVASGSEHEIEDHCSEQIAATDADHTQENLANIALMTSNPNEKTDDELVSVMRGGGGGGGTLRRCLDFEMARVRTKNTDENSNTGSNASQSDERNATNEKHLLPTKRNGNSQRCILPGIGLHLNALANLKDYKGMNNEKLSSGRQLSLPSSTSSLHLSISQEHQHLSLVSVSSERDLVPSDNGVQPAEDCSQGSAYMAGEDFNQNSPKKKRRKSETGGCKHCNCKKSKCLKLYCECFAAGVYCIEPCNCQDCFNKPINEDTVVQTRKQIESRNPIAFTPKVIETEDEPNKTPASARHKRGCNCKKSSCLKKYCECYQGGVGCSISCRCEGCKNAYGRKDGSAPIGIEAEPEETEACDKAVVEKALQKTEIQNIEHHPHSVLEATPLRISRPLLLLPSSSKGKPPRSFVTTISGSSGLFTNQKHGKSNSVWSPSKHFQTVPDDEMPDILRGDSSPITCIKTSSPNGKRISSPNCDLGSSPSRRGGRKLILQSIPSFPSLTPHH
ncbi:protein tesmin/TSO1-like CXC 2 [Gastrolobium bilobum]|uniref:protein tesmin/TSO1-like CXC 2 n=1 Tax=Gastrolobium bilobum TaxID=150636 RepID=UPI002AAF89BA|nr:protein tesmin/TSO1-like CXC 2 [Gastrolobium bilobum]